MPLIAKEPLMEMLLLQKEEFATVQPKILQQRVQS